MDTPDKTFPMAHNMAGKSSKGNIPEIDKAGNRQNIEEVRGKRDTQRKEKLRKKGQCLMRDDACGGGALIFAPKLPKSKCCDNLSCKPQVCDPKLPKSKCCDNLSC